MGPMIETVSGYRFSPSDLGVSNRSAGISAFMRIKNGADFLEPTIRSHIGFFDEIVAVFNQCTDATPEILARLAEEFAPKLKVWRYEDRVFPPGSEGHVKTPADSPSSMVTYSNFALSRTTRSIVTKLDDDHIAMPEALEAMVAKVRSPAADPRVMHSFAGINLIRGEDGTMAVPRLSPLSGSGDIGFFTVTPRTVFTHDRRFERAPRQGLVRRFTGFVYWHLKYLKQGMGFANYELEENPHSRFAARRKAMTGGGVQVMTLEELVASRSPGWSQRAAAMFSAKQRLLLDRDLELQRDFRGLSLSQALEMMIDPAIRPFVFKQGEML